VRAGRHGIYSTLVPGVALAQTAQGETTTTENPMGGYRILGIRGTTWVEPAAVSQKWTQAGFIAVDKKNEQATH